MNSKKMLNFKLWRIVFTVKIFVSMFLCRSTLFIFIHQQNAISNYCYQDVVLVLLFLVFYNMLICKISGCNRYIFCSINL